MVHYDRDIDSKIVDILSNQYRRARRNPHIVRLRSQYVYGYDLEHLGGGLTTYFSSSGSLEWMDACFVSPGFKG